MRLALALKPLCRFEVMCEPRGWERSGEVIRWKNGHPFVHHYVTTEEAEYRESFAWAARTAHRGPPSKQPIALTIIAFMPIPSSWKLSERIAAQSDAKFPTGTPDVDNMAKSIADALAGIIYVTDAQVVELSVVKRYSDQPLVAVDVKEFVHGETAA
jgi:Holliday junction resolvase RusA-like endonuclease